MRLQQIKTGVDKSMVWVMTQLDGLHQRWFFKAEEWPVVSGQFYVGQKDSPVAVCTLSSLDLMRKIGRRVDCHHWKDVYRESGDRKDDS